MSHPQVKGQPVTNAQIFQLSANYGINFSGGAISLASSDPTHVQSALPCGPNIFLISPHCVVNVR